MAIIKTSITKVVGLVAQLSTINSTIQSNYNTLSSALTQETSDRTSAVSTVATNLSNHIANDFDPLASVVAMVNGTDATAGSFRKAIKDAVDVLIGGANINFDTLKELQDWLMTNPDAATLFTQLGSLRSDLETADSSIRTDFAAADATLNTNLRAYAESLVSNATGALRARMELVTVSGDNVVLTDAPKLGNIGGINAIGNYAMVMFTDVDGASYCAPVVADTNDVTGKTFTILVDTTGEWDTKQVKIQYFY